MEKRMGIVLTVLLLAVGGYAPAAEQPVPKQVQMEAEKAEDIIDLYLNKNWKDAWTLFDSLKQSRPQVEASMREQQMPRSSVYQFEFLLFRLQELNEQQGNNILAALTANQLTAILIDLEQHYAHTAPLEIAWMDYLGREIVLLAQLPNDYGWLMDRNAQLEQTWNALKPVIKEHKGAKLAVQVDAVIANLKKTTSRSDQIKYGNQILDLVDALEALFK